MDIQHNWAGRTPLNAWGVLCVLLLVWSAGSGCSVRRYALNQVADALAHSGSTYASDDDPELVKAAVPFSLKLLEALLAENPTHKGLLTAAASGFTQYAYAFVEQEADELEARDLAAAEAMRKRARRLYLRAKQYGLSGLEANHPGLKQALQTNPKAAVRVFTKAEVPMIYWTAAAWASAITLSKDNPDLITQIPAMEALIDRALELDESYGAGAIHSFMITYEMARKGATGDPTVRARQHFERALAIAGENSAGPMVTLAEAVTIQKQNVKEFEALLNRALVVNPDAHPDTRLLNLVMQRRARWLLSRKADLFLIENEEKPAGGKP